MATTKKYSWSLLFLVLPAFCIFFFQGSALSGDVRSYVSPQFLLELDGAFAGYLWSAEGGNVKVEVINEPAGPSYFIKKHVGQPRCEGIILNAGANMSRAFYQWIKDTIELKSPRKNGAIIMVDYNFREMSRTEFFSGLISGVTFPAPDAASKDPARLQVKIAPEVCRSSRSPGKVYPMQSMQKQKTGFSPITASG